MTITVQGPGGVVIEFPDGTSADVIANVMRQGVGSSSAKPQDDPITAKVRSELEAERAKGVPAPSALPRLGIQGATFNTSDEIMAGVMTPIEMFRRGTWSPVEGYNYAKAREDLELEEARKNTGALGTVAEVGGGILSGSGLARAGMTLMPRAATASLPARIGGLAADSTIMGGVAGAAGASGSDRLTEGAKGAAIGGVAGGAIGAVAPVVSALGRNTMGWMRATANPEGYARSQLARALMERGRSADDVGRAVSDAAAEGQPYAVADALGNPGQRMLSSVTRAPGAGRTQAVDFLETRQAGQGRRVANILDEGFASNGQTAAQNTVAVKDAARAANANPYATAYSQGDTAIWSPELERLSGSPTVQSAMKGAVNVWADNVIADGYGAMNPGALVEGGMLKQLHGKVPVFPNLQFWDYTKRILDNEIGTAVRAGQDAKVRTLTALKNGIVKELDKASPAYADARSTAKGFFDIQDAGKAGTQAAKRGRTEDTITLFNSLTPEQQAAYRTGYADPLIERVQGSAHGVNKAREFTSDAFQTEGRAMAPNAETMMRRLGRENEMFATRNHALGGSRTADNLADADSLGASPEIIANLLSGRFLTAGQNMLARSTGALSGNTPAVRERLAQALLATGQAPDLQAMLNEAVQSEEMRRMILAAALRGVTGGGAVALPATGVTNTRR